MQSICPNGSIQTQMQPCQMALRFGTAVHVLAQENLQLLQFVTCTW